MEKIENNTKKQSYESFESFLKDFEKKILENNMQDIIDGLNLSKEQYRSCVKRLYEYMIYLLDKNQYINLTSIRLHEEFLEKHYIDSIYPLKYFGYLEEVGDFSFSKNSEFKLLDIGTGGGFPLVPLKVFSNFDSYCMDKVGKKLKVIEGFSEVDKDFKVCAIHNRAEIAAHQKEYREKFSIVTARALSSFANVVEYMAGFVKVGGICVIMRGREQDFDLNIISKFGFELVTIDNYSIFDSQRTNIVLRKVKKLDAKLPSKNPKHYLAQSNSAK